MQRLDKDLANIDADPEVCEYLNTLHERTLDSLTGATIPYTHNKQQKTKQLTRKEAVKMTKIFYQDFLIGSHTRLRDMLLIKDSRAIATAAQGVQSNPDTPDLVRRDADEIFRLEKANHTAPIMHLVQAISRIKLSASWEDLKEKIKTMKESMKGPQGSGSGTGDAET